MKTTAKYFPNIWLCPYVEGQRVWDINYSYWDSLWNYYIIQFFLYNIEYLLINGQQCPLNPEKKHPYLLLLV